MKEDWNLRLKINGGLICCVLTTLTTIKADQVMKDHFASEYNANYFNYLPPTPSLLQLQGNVTAEHLLLPIPQHEIDTNTQLVILQNPGY